MILSYFLTLKSKEIRFSNDIIILPEIEPTSPIFELCIEPPLFPLPFL